MAKDEVTPHRMTLLSLQAGIGKPLLCCAYKHFVSALKLLSNTYHAQALMLVLPLKHLIP